MFDEVIMKYACCPSTNNFGLSFDKHLAQEIQLWRGEINSISDPNRLVPGWSEADNYSSPTALQLPPDKYVEYITTCVIDIPY